MTGCLRSEGLKARGLFVIMTFLWGLGLVVVRIGGQAGVPPCLGAGIRFILATGLLAGIAAVRRVPVPLTLLDVERYLVVGLFEYAAPFALSYLALLRIEAGLAGVVNAMGPLFVAVLARFFLGEPLTGRRVSGIGLGLAGFLVVHRDSVASPNPGAAAGVAMIVLAAACYSVGAIYIRGRCQSADPVALNLVAMGVAAAVLIAFAIGIERPWPAIAPVGVATIVWLAVFSSVVAFLIYFWLLARVEATRVATCAYLIPLVSIVLGRLMLGEVLRPGTWLGAGTVLTGVALVLYDGRGGRVVSADAGPPAPK